MTIKDNSGQTPNRQFSGHRNDSIETSRRVKKGGYIKSSPPKHYLVRHWRVHHDFSEFLLRQIDLLDDHVVSPKLNYLIKTGGSQHSSARLPRGQFLTGDPRALRATRSNALHTILGTRSISFAQPINRCVHQRALRQAAAAVNL